MSTLIFIFFSIFFLVSFQLYFYIYFYIKPHSFHHFSLAFA
ncbi:hypothetical protein BACCAP_04394 [Pseudoflavonifractor capillosus ATCC 29799]|uniref:Uncharacterized protein n=1 Tax=Pseudoflavonifractor capillosus ATCC 29799 TaxID=411467 RepID=A6P1M7_9FIRM|nr:hypothetical protein BACCAP_04394 [Pseudoflavonifractor capillosus ATCC 29799]